MPGGATILNRSEPDRGGGLLEDETGRVAGKS
jgi:hypothetical protein